jgi:hypothetical protein
MRRIALALALLLLTSFTLLPGAAWAGGSHLRVFVGQGFQSACCVFIGPRHPFGHRHFFFSQGFFLPPPSSFIVVDPAPQPVWIPGFWWWSGFQWVWVPGHWAQ